jgi:hypothetical protein
MRVQPSAFETEVNVVLSLVPIPFKTEIIATAIPDLPPLKWSSLKYGLTLEDEINVEEEAYS